MYKTLILVTKRYISEIITTCTSRYLTHNLIMCVVRKQFTFVILCQFLLCIPVFLFLLTPSASVRHDGHVPFLPFVSIPSLHYHFLSFVNAHFFTVCRHLITTPTCRSSTESGAFEYLAHGIFLSLILQMLITYFLFP